MNPNTEYEIFAQEVYQLLLDADRPRGAKVQHNIKLKGLSGCEHQIDVYWEYKLDGKRHRVAIECKNYGSSVPVGKVRDFFGVLHDLGDVRGIMVSKKGFQEGAKKFAEQYGISLHELREPGTGETIIGEIDLVMHLDMRQTLFLIDEEWAAEKGLNLVGYRRFLNATRLQNDGKWTHATHLPLQTDENIIRDSQGNAISSLPELEEQLSDDQLHGDPVSFAFDDAYINVHGAGPVKIKEVRYEYENKVEEKRIAIDAEGFVKAILTDALNGNKQVVASFPNGSK